MNKTFSYGDNCERRVSVTPANAGNLLSLMIETRYPKANHPVWQRNIQIIGTPCEIWEIGTFLHNASKP